MFSVSWGPEMSHSLRWKNTKERLPQIWNSCHTWEILRHPRYFSLSSCQHIYKYYLFIPVKKLNLDIYLSLYMMQVFPFHVETDYFLYLFSFLSQSSIQSISCSHHFTKPVLIKVEDHFILTSSQNTLYVTEHTTIFIPVSDNFIYCLFFSRAFTII